MSRYTRTVLLRDDRSPGCARLAIIVAEIARLPGAFRGVPTVELPRVKPRREEVPAGSNLCEFCTAKCCRYFALPVDTPSTSADFDYLRWYLLHDRAAIFVDEGTWYLLVHTDCQHLLPDHRCGIYETRPQICREYTTDKCEYEDDWTYDQYFELPEQVEEYREALEAGRSHKCRRSPKPALLPILSR